MKAFRLFFCLLLLCLNLAACAPGHSGDNLVAFVRAGQLWTSDPNGTNASAIVQQDQPVLSFSWSPTHQLLTFRTLDSSFSTNQIPPNTPDLPSAIQTVGVDGGSPVTLIEGQKGFQHSNAFWSSDGNRLIYRESSYPNTNPDAVLWWLSQNDQPSGIARHLLPSSLSLPSINTTQKRTLLSTPATGIYITDLTGQHLQSLLPGPLPGHPLSASLERALWQPATLNPAVLYATEALQHASNSDAPLKIHLVLHLSQHRERTLSTCTCTQFDWSPDGKSILTADGKTFTILDTTGQIRLTVQAEPQSIPSWSPDGRFLLLDSSQALSLVNLQNGQVQRLLGSLPATEPTSPRYGVNTLLQPTPNSPWSPDGHSFLFLTHGRTSWGKVKLNEGLFTASLDANGRIQHLPVMIAQGKITQMGWSYQAAESSFLY